MRLDHVGVVAAEIDKGVAAFQRLGFCLTPRGFHSGSVMSGGPVVPWGSANHCMMLQNGYIEMLAVVDPSLHSSARALIAKYEGTHIVAFGCDGAEAAVRLMRENGAQATGPINLQRDLKVVATGETATAKFLNIYADAAMYPEARFLVIEHMTPELLWQPEFLTHPNGAVGLTEVFLCVEEPAETVAKLSKLTGSDARSHNLELASGSVHVLDPWELKRRIPRAAAIRVPFAAAFTVEVSDLGETHALLRKNGIEPIAEESDLWIDASDACGAAICFKQAREKAT